MQHFQLSKFSSSNDQSWISISEIGDDFGGETLTKEAYLLCEDKYIEALKIFLNNTQCNDFKVLRFEDNRGLQENDDIYFNIEKYLIKIRGGEILSVDTMLILFRLCLREVMWLRLQSKSGCYITFGYDFYVNIGVPDNVEVDKKKLEKLGLFLSKLDRDPHE